MTTALQRLCQVDDAIVGLPGRQQVGDSLLLCF